MPAEHTKRLAAALRGHRTSGKTSSAASRLGRLSKARNSAGHPGTELKRDIKQFFGTDGDVNDSTHDELKTQIQGNGLNLLGEQCSIFRHKFLKNSP